MIFNDIRTVMQAELEKCNGSYTTLAFSTGLSESGVKTITRYNKPFKINPKTIKALEQCGYELVLRNLKTKDVFQSHSGLTLDEKARICRERGITYGQLQTEEYLRSMGQ